MWLCVPSDLIFAYSRHEFDTLEIKKNNQNRIYLFNVHKKNKKNVYPTRIERISFEEFSMGLAKGEGEGIYWAFDDVINYENLFNYYLHNKLLT